MKRLIHSQCGSSAVEFALIAPILILFLFGIVVYSTLFTVASGIQQLAAESARASLAGMSDTERDQLARSFITSSLPSYPFIAAQSLSVSTATLTSPQKQMQVSLTYDLSGSFIFRIGVIPPPTRTLQRSAIVDLGNAS